MTEKNIDNLLNYAYLIGIFYIVLIGSAKVYKENNSKTVTSVKTATEEKNIWDKLKIVSLIITGIAAFLYAIFKLLELFMPKK